MGTNEDLETDTDEELIDFDALDEDIDEELTTGNDLLSLSELQEEEEDEEYEDDIYHD